MGQIIYRWKPTENAKLFHVDDFLWFLAVFKQFRKRRDHSFCLYHETDSSKMQRVKNLNFSACLLELHSVFSCAFFTRSSPSTHWNWASDIPMESYCKHATFPCWSFFHTRDGFINFHLKFIQCSSWTSCCFHVKLLWRIFVCNFLIHSWVLHKWYSFCTNLSHNNFFNFLRPRTWTYTNDISVVLK